MNRNSTTLPSTPAPAPGRLARWMLLALVAFLVISALGPSGRADNASDALMPWLPDTIGHWREPIERAAEAHGISPALIASQMLIESGGNPQALSGQGAVGLMQVMPATAQDIARTRGIVSYDLWDPETNIDFGSWYLARQLETFGTPGLASAAYNGGPGMVMGWRAGASMPAESARSQHYIEGMWRERHFARSATFDDWLARYGAGMVAEARRHQSAGLAAD